MYNRYFKSTISIFAVCLVLVILFGVFGPYMMDSSAPPSASINGSEQENPRISKIKKAISAGELVVCAKSFHPSMVCKGKNGKESIWNSMLIFLLKNKTAANSAGGVNFGHLVLLCSPGLNENSLLTENMPKIMYTAPVRWKNFIAASWCHFPDETPLFFIYQTDIGVSNNYSLYTLFMDPPCQPGECANSVIEKQLIGMTAEDTRMGNFKDKNSAKIFISTQATNSRRYHDREYGKYRPITYADGHFQVAPTVPQNKIKDISTPLPIIFGTKPAPSSKPSK